MNTVDKDIEMPAKFSVCVQQVDFYGWIALDDLFDDLSDRRSADGKFTLVIDIIFHHCRETDDGHENILPSK